MPSSSFQPLPGAEALPANTIVSIGRVYNAPLTNGTKMFVVPSGEEVTIRTFLPQCDSFFEVSQIPEGCICAVVGVEKRKTCKATNKYNLMSASPPTPLPPIYDRVVNSDLLKTSNSLASDPVIKIAIETDPDDLGVLERGLKRLNMCDDDITVSITRKNEYILAAAGETQLGVVVNDLNRVYCERPIEIRVKDVDVGVRETVRMTKWEESKPDMVYSRDNLVILERNKQAKVMQQVGEEEDYKHCFEGAKNGVTVIEIEGGSVTLSVLPQVADAPAEPSLELLFSGKDDDCAAMVRIPSTAANGGGDGAVPDALKTSFMCAFDDACRGGLICDEPLHGVVVVLERWTGDAEVFGPIIVGALAKGICAAAMTRPVRLVESYVVCEFQTSFGALGEVYAVLSKRRGRVIQETSIEGTDLVTIECYVPMSDMKGLGGEMLEKSGGDAIGTGTRFSHWEVIEDDPFWQPSTEEEREEYGDGKKRGEVAGLGAVWVRVLEIRKRKGRGMEMLVAAADKQRNLSRNK
jgi:ribosome assembly protein 1